MIDRVNVIGSHISACDLKGALELVSMRLQEGGGGYVCFTNVHATVLGRRDPTFLAATNSSFLSVADGKPVYWAGRVKGNSHIGHIPGPDFFIEALKQLPHRRHFFYGSTPQVLERLSARLKLAAPAAQLCGTLSPPFGPLSDSDKRQHYAEICDARPDIVWVGLGAPKQELWMAEAWPHLKPSILMGVGAAFDFHAGTTRRAPKLFGTLGLEWAYRLCQEPRRLWKRYLVTNTLFLAYLARDWAAPAGRTDL
jgi:N-acetylglucosaminyldiphosphoundecaprenol N-acetyl-beta-D-mannosaminyltransferase